MPRSNLQSLLPPSLLSTSSRTDVLQELTAVAADRGGSTVGSASSGTVSVSGLDVLQGSFQDVNTQLSTLTSQIASLGSAQQTQTSATQDNTQALGQNTSTKDGSSIGSTLEGVASSVLGSAVSPIISGLLSLFGGDSTFTAAAPTPFKLPPSADFQAGLTGSGQVVPVDSGQGGQVRTPSISAAPQVTIQVNAMDSQSFLDHSDEIANAVKSAILSSHSLNDVLSEL